jgi:hypothetical protein
LQLQNEKSFGQVFSPQKVFSAVAEPLRPESDQEKAIATKNAGRPREEMYGAGRTVGRIACFFGLIAVLAFALNATISVGLRRIKTSTFGAENQMMEGKINAQVIITGSSRASSHYDPRVISAVTGRTAFNLGRNGSQTDMQVAALKAYLEHNRKPELVIHNLDAFSFVTTREVYDSAQYVPYLNDQEFYVPLEKINPDTWKSRYLPLYGYVVDDMNFSWILGLKGFFGWSPSEDLFSGFSPRSKKWSDEFQHFKASNPNGVSFGIEPNGIQDVEELVRICKQNEIQLIFVYSPEFSEMQTLTTDRAEIFGKFRALSDRYAVPFWDYSDWKYASDRDFFQNSQHLNDQGAAIFSADLADRLKGYFVAQSGSLEHSGAAVSSKRSN